MRTQFVMAAAVALALSPGLYASTIASSNFNTDNEGWAALTADPGSLGYPAGGTAALAYNAAGGNTGGYVSVADPDNFDTFFQAPPAFLGNLSSLLNGILRYDVITNQTVDYDGADLVLKGGGLVLVHDVSPSPAGVAWTTVSIGLAPGTGWHLNTLAGAAPTLSDFQTALGAVDQIWITAEFHNGVTETSGLDNVSLTSADAPSNVPEPQAALLLVSGMGALLWKRRAFKQS
jgi:hypothetical protein